MLGAANAVEPFDRGIVVEPEAPVRLLAGRAPKWLAADAASGRYVFVNPSDEPAPLWLETPRTIVECDEFAFGRVEIDEQAGTLSVEATGPIGQLRLRAEGPLRFQLNGLDVTDRLTPPDDSGVRELR